MIVEAMTTLAVEIPSRSYRRVISKECARTSALQEGSRTPGTEIGLFPMAWPSGPGNHRGSRFA